MGLKDAFGGDSKWKLGLGTSTHGGNAFEGRGKDPADANAKSEARKLKREVNAAKGKIRGCKKCTKQGVCRKHIKDSKFIAANE
jgi:hypothetical protein